MKSLQPHAHPLLFVAALALLLGMGIGAAMHKETIVVREGVADTPAALSSVNLMIDYGTGTIRTWNTVSWHEAMSTVGLLETVAGAKNIVLQTKDNGDKNISVRSIDGVGDESNGAMRWQYWVNNTYEPKIASKYFLKPGDIVVWKYAKEQPK
jgi:hypothetical protein